MAKHDNDTTRAKGGATTADAMEQRVVAFAEQLGRIAGTLQANAEGWLDREALIKQIASVRDSATELLEQLAGGATKGSKRNPAAPAALGKKKGRSVRYPRQPFPAMVVIDFRRGSESLR